MRLIAGSVGFVLCALAFGGCDAQSAGAPLGGGGTPLQGDASGGTDASVECCPISPEPDCEMDYGGTKIEGSNCLGLIDGMALPDAAWERRINEDGCPYWVEPEPRGSWDCCGCPGAPPDGPDATPDAMPDATPPLPEAGACEPPQGWYYDTAGCDELPKCRGPEFDACYAEACSCDGETMGGCGFFDQPIAHFGPCTDGGTAVTFDSGLDGG